MTEKTSSFLKNAFRCVAALLLLAATLLSFAACSEKNAAMKLGKVSVSEGEYAYYLSSYKSYWLYVFGGSDTDEFWDTKYDTGDGRSITAFEYLTAQTEEAIKAKLAAEYLFEKYKLKLSEEAIESVNFIIAGILSGIGGESAFYEDPLTKELGVTLDDIKNTYLADEKAAVLREYLYGESGIEIVTDEERRTFYENNYFRFRHIYLMNVDIVYDEDGNKQYDANGSLLTEEITEERRAEKKALAESLRDRILAGEDMDTLIAEFSEENNPLKNYPNGHYFTIPNSYLTGLSNAVTGMDIGDVIVAESEGGIHVIQRLPLDEGAYQNSENKLLFSDFNALVEENKYKNKLQQCYDDIVINTGITESYSLRTIPYTSSWANSF